MTFKQVSVAMCSHEFRILDTEFKTLKRITDSPVNTALNTAKILKFTQFKQQRIRSSKSKSKVRLYYSVPQFLGAEKLGRQCV